MLLCELATGRPPLGYGEDLTREAFLDMVRVALLMPRRRGGRNARRLCCGRGGSWGLGVHGPPSMWCPNRHAHHTCTQVEARLVDDRAVDEALPEPEHHTSGLREVVGWVRPSGCVVCVSVGVNVCRTCASSTTGILKIVVCVCAYVAVRSGLLRIEPTDRWGLKQVQEAQFFGPLDWSAIEKVG